ncbi:MAG: hypothetical protein RIG63_31030 [Coleofasciculus chthonoplastes F3-SA18-01]
MLRRRSWSDRSDERASKNSMDLTGTLGITPVNLADKSWSDPNEFVW